MPQRHVPGSFALHAIVSLFAAENILPVELTNKWDIQYFALNSPQLRDGLWKNVVRGRLYVHLPAANNPEDTDAWINTFYVAVDKTGHSFIKQARTTKVFTDMLHCYIHL